MNIPFKNEEYDEIKQLKKYIPAKIISGIDTYCIQRKTEKYKIYLSAFAAFIGRYNFGKAKFSIDDFVYKKGRVLFNEELKIINGNFDSLINNISKYYSQYNENNTEDILLRFCNKEEQEYMKSDDFNCICLEINLESNKERFCIKSKKNNIRIVDFLEEFEDYIEELLEKNTVIIDKSINVLISSSIEKYYIEEQTERAIGYYNYTLNAVDRIEDKLEEGELIHIIVYTLWDIADDEISIEDNCKAFELYNKNLLNQLNNKSIAIILSDLSIIKYRNEIRNKIEFYKNDFIKKCKIFCNSILDYSGYNNTNIYNTMLYKIANIPYKKEFFRLIANEIVWSYLRYKKRGYKLIVLDADDTLWDGIISDDGIENITIGKKKEMFQKKLKILKEKGVLLAICSRNNFCDIEKLFRKKTEMKLNINDFVEIVANFDSKYKNMLYISEKYNICLSNILFIDDSTFECGEMMKRLPDVTTLLYSDNYDFSNIIQNVIPVHNIVITKEDNLRTNSTKYINSDVDEMSKEKFWRELNAKFLFSFPDSEDIPRIVQLNSRVNRYRLSLDELLHNVVLERAKNNTSFVIRVKDKFGYYGIVSYISWKIEGDIATIDNWIISCRLSTEYSEFAIWNFVLEYLKQYNIKKIRLRYEDTKKNVRFLSFCSNMNFIHENGFCYCGIDYKSKRYSEEFAECKLGKFIDKINPKIELRNYDKKINILNYKISQELYDISKSINSKNLWLMLGDNTGDINSSSEESEDLLRNIDKMPSDEIRLIALWENILKCEVDDYEKSFIEYGGNSIKYMELIALIIEYWNIDVTKIPFRVEDSASDHEKYIREFKNTNKTDFYKMSKKKFDVPEISKRFFSYSMKDIALHIPYVLRIDDEKSDKCYLEEIIQNLLNKYRVFKSIFKYKNKNIIVCVKDYISIEILEHTCQLDVPDNKFIDSLRREFDMKKAPLINFDLIHCKSASFLLIDYCHVIVDGLCAERMTKYIHNEIIGKKMTSWLENQFDYYDYCYNNHNNYTDYNRLIDEKYWLNELNGISLINNLPFYFQKGTITDPVRIKIEKNICKKISKICIARNITEFSFYLSTYALFLHTLTSKSDITIGIPINCKKSVTSKYDIGQYVNTFTYRSILSDNNENLSSYFEKSNEKYHENIRHSNIMYQDVARICSEAYNIDSLFNTIFVFENDNNYLGIDVLEYYQNSFKSMLDLNIKRSDDCAYIQINYDANKLSYDNSTQIGIRFYGYLQMILKYFENESEKSIVPLFFNESDFVKSGLYKEIGKDTIIDRFEKTVTKYSNKTCFEIEGIQYSYRDVNCKSNYYANEIVKKLGHKQKRILVICDSMKICAFSIISVLKSGNVYVPVSPLTPENRIIEIIEKCEITAYIAGRKRAFIDKELLDIDFGIDYTDSKNVNFTDINTDAYVIYTSGTTGKSKGILVKHKGLVNTIIARNEILGLTNYDNSILLMGTASDGFMTSFFSPITTGATLYFPDSILNLNYIIDLIENRKIYTFLCTPTMYNSILNNIDINSLEEIRLVALAGENVSEILIEKSKNLYPNLRIANEYGPTENTICTSIQPDLIQGHQINAGKLINNVDGMIVNKGEKSCPEFVVGELYLSGYGLSKGYIGEKEYNDIKFVFINGKKWYKTGDLAFWDEQENLYIVGRVDNQVKINGYRVDLNEIQGELLNYPNIESCAVTYDEEKRLHAYYISNTDVSKKDIIRYLNKRLNRYMVPMNYSRVSYIPVTDAGKMDMKLLKNCVIESNEICSETKIESDNPIVIQIIEVFKQLLADETIDANSDFFEYGGSSIESVLLLEKIKKLFNVELEVEDIRMNSTPLELAKMVSFDNYRIDGKIECLPFNKFWFIDCYFTAILAILLFYNKPIAQFIKSFKIDKVTQNGEYKHHYSMKKPLKKIFKDIGIGYNSAKFDDNIEEDLKSLLNHNVPIVVHVDCFYLPYCYKYYEKKHCNHVLTVIGMDNSEEYYRVIDQKNLQSVSFTFNYIDKNSLINSIKEAMKNRDKFYDADYVFLTNEKKNIINLYTSQRTQFKEVVEKTLVFLKNDYIDLNMVMERMLNYLQIEKEVLSYENQKCDLKQIEKIEIKIRRLLMKSIGNANNAQIKDELISALEHKW